jgi:hypothetical protein
VPSGSYTPRCDGLKVGLSLPDDDVEYADGSAREHGVRPTVRERSDRPSVRTIEFDSFFRHEQPKLVAIALG